MHAISQERVNQTKEERKKGGQSEKKPNAK
jgi:hypothetical protein